MSAAALLERLAVAGVKLTALGADRLAAEPAEALTDELREAIRRHKAELLEALRTKQADAYETPLSDAEVRTLAAWLDGIGEDDSDMRDAVLRQCRRDPEARRYFLGQAAAVVRLHLTLEAEDGTRTEALLEVPRERYDGERVLELFERHRMAGTTRVVEVRQEVPPDERRHCRDCTRLRNGICTAAAQIGALPGYRPADDLPRRCDAFQEREDGE